MRTIIETLLVNERGIAFDPVSGETYQLLGPALPLVKLLQQGADNAMLLQFLLEEYNVDAVTARRDLDAFLHSLEEMKLWAMQKDQNFDLRPLRKTENSRLVILSEAEGSVPSARFMGRPN